MAGFGKPSFANRVCWRTEIIGGNHIYTGFSVEVQQCESSNAKPWSKMIFVNFSRRGRQALQPRVDGGLLPCHADVGR